MTISASTFALLLILVSHVACGTFVLADYESEIKHCHQHLAQWIGKSDWDCDTEMQQGMPRTLALLKSTFRTSQRVNRVFALYRDMSAYRSEMHGVMQFMRVDPTDSGFEGTGSDARKLPEDQVHALQAELMNPFHNFCLGVTTMVISLALYSDLAPTADELAALKDDKSREVFANVEAWVALAGMLCHVAHPGWSSTVLYSGRVGADDQWLMYHRRLLSARLIIDRNTDHRPKPMCLVQQSVALRFVEELFEEDDEDNARIFVSAAVMKADFFYHHKIPRPTKKLSDCSVKKYLGQLALVVHVANFSYMGLADRYSVLHMEYGVLCELYVELRATLTAHSSCLNFKTMAKNRIDDINELVLAQKGMLEPDLGMGALFFFDVLCETRQCNNREYMLKNVRRHLGQTGEPEYENIYTDANFAIVERKLAAPEKGTVNDFMVKCNKRYMI